MIQKKIVAKSKKRFGQIQATVTVGSREKYVPINSISTLIENARSLTL
jgi:hypothetical protein